MELPDWLRGIVLLGRDGLEYRVVGVDDNGYLGVILKAAAEVTIPGDVSVDQNDSIREMQGADGVNLRTVAVDANGQMIMVPRGATGNYMAVDASGYLGAVLMADAAVTIAADVNVTQEDSIRAMQGADGATLRTVAVDDAGRMIVLIRGGAGNVLAVDAAGFMTTVMKGTYGATLKTLATDDEGYLVAILKDNSDQWGKKISVGLAELAARLGSPISWDRRGQVALIETFTNGLGWAVLSTSGTGALAELYPGVSQFGGYSVKLTTGTTVSKSAGVTIYGDFSPSGRLGFEFAFSMTSQPDDIYILGKIWDGTYEHRAYARVHKATNKLQVYNSTPAYADAADFQLPAVAQLFASVKVVIDIDENKWVRLLNRGTETDLSAVATSHPAVAVHPYFSFQILAVESAAVSHTIYVDRMIVTTNEP